MRCWRCGFNPRIWLLGMLAKASTSFVPKARPPRLRFDGFLCRAISVYRKPNSSRRVRFLSRCHFPSQKSTNLF
jgi:hypothetical protein